VRAAVACALRDDVTLWCHTASHQLSLADPANQRLLAAARRHLASEHQQSRHAAHEQRDKPAQLGREAAFASGLVSSSDDSSQCGDLNVERGGWRCKAGRAGLPNNCSAAQSVLTRQ